MYILPVLVKPATVTMELCVCGKFADLECSECGGRGYCSIECQQDDWFKHALVCRAKIEEKRKRKKSKSKKKNKKKHKKHKKFKSRASSDFTPSNFSPSDFIPNSFTPSVDVCICGKEAEFECSMCEKRGYCSEECQLKDWNTHQSYCKRSKTQPDKEDELEQNTDHDMDISNSMMESEAKEAAQFSRYRCAV